VREPVSEAVTGRPSPVLRPFVARYGGYCQEGFAPGTHQGLPSRYMTLIVSLGPPTDIAVMPDPAQAPGAFDAFVGGLHASAATVRHDGNQAGIQLYLTPLGARTLLGLPAAALANTVVALDEVLGRPAVELVERLGAAPSWPERFAVLDDVLAAALRDAPDPPPEVAWAWRKLVATGGAVDVASLADEVGWSRRHLGERFRAELGLPPKVAARVLRFERSRRMLQQPARPGLADVAVACDYYDQAHMTREWREIAGCTPAAWITTELPNLQDAGVEAVAE
jgi:AraC-like DNA-binding protein